MVHNGLNKIKMVFAAQYINVILYFTYLLTYLLSGFGFAFGLGRQLAWPWPRGPLVFALALSSKITRLALVLVLKMLSSNPSVPIGDVLIHSGDFFHWSKSVDFDVDMARLNEFFDKQPHTHKVSQSKDCAVSA